MKQNGYTLIEIVIVVVIIGILASIASQSFKTTEDNRRFEDTASEMEALARAIVGDQRLITNGYRTDFGYVGDVGALPNSLDNLIANPGGYSTWKGPYIRGNFNENTEDYKRDAWNNLYTYTGNVTISSNADGNTVTKQLANSSADLTSNSIQGIVRDKSGLPPSDSASNVTITVYYPNGSGSMTSSSTTPSASGEFSFNGVVPIGIHQIRAVVSGVDDTTSRYLAINPASVTLAGLRFASDLWGSSGGGSANIEYVTGSAIVSGQGNRNIEFDIINSGAASATITSLILTYVSTPAAYYQKINWNIAVAYNNPRLGSGETANLSSSQTINPSETVTISFDTFRDSQGGGGSIVDMSGVNFQLEFSTGDIITFSTP